MSPVAGLPGGVAAALTMFLAGCAAQPDGADRASAPAAAAVPLDRSQGPIAATVSADGAGIAITVPERSIELSVDEVFGGQKTRFDRAVIVAQAHQGERYDVLLRIEAPSDPQRDGGRCANGREVSMRHIGFDTGSTVMSSSNEIESCVRRVRVAAQRREPDGRLEFDLKRGQDDGSESDIYLRYDLAEFEKSFSF